MSEASIRNALDLVESTQSYAPVFDVKEAPSHRLSEVYLGEPKGTLASLKVAANTPKPLRVVKLMKLWEGADKLCLHLDLDLGGDRLFKYKTGDHLAVWPSNPDHEVEKLLAVLGWGGRRDIPLSINEIDDVSRGKSSMPSPTTADALLRHYLEICGMLSAEAMTLLAGFAPSEDACIRLQRLSNDRQVFRAEITDKRLTLGDVLKATGKGVPWTIPLSLIIETFKPMQPRYYSISSSAMVEPRKVSLTAVVNKPSGDPLQGCHGIATGLLYALERLQNPRKQETDDGCLPQYHLDGPRGMLSGGKLISRIRQSTFKLPFKASTPIIMVGAGTGVAPFRAFVQERCRRKDIGQDVGTTLLFMGFRKRTEVIYRKEWEAWQSSIGSDIFRYRTAVSRQDGQPKMYVQDYLKEEGEEVMNILNRDGCRFYICGSAEMARDVVNTLIEVRMRGSLETEELARLWLRQLRESKRLLEDVWS